MPMNMDTYIHKTAQHDNICKIESYGFQRPEEGILWPLKLTQDSFFFPQGTTRSKEALLKRS